MSSGQAACTPATSTAQLHIPGRFERALGRVPTRIIMLCAATIYASAFVVVWLVGVPAFKESSALGILDKVAAAQQRYLEATGSYAEDFSELVQDGGLAVVDDLDQRPDIRMDATGGSYRVEIDPGTGQWWSITNVHTDPTPLVH